MKKFLLFMFALVFSTGMALADEKTIQTNATSGTWTGDANGYTATIDGFEISYLKNESTSDLTAPQSDHIRVYKGAQLVIKGVNGETITKVVLNCIAANRCFDMTVGDGVATANTDDKTITWEGTTTSFEAVASNGQVRISSVELTYTSAGGVTKQDAGLAFSETYVGVEQGAEFTAPTFTKATTAAVTFASDNEEVATVSAEGVISLAGGLGTAVITATAEANDEYNAGTATCTVEVFYYNTYKKADAVTSGKGYLLVAQRDDKTNYAYPLQETYNYGYLKVQSVDGLVDEIKVKSTYDDAFVFTAVDGGYTIQDCYGRYLYMDDSHNSFQVGTDASTATWTVEAVGDGTFTITNNGKFIQWGQGTYTTFGAYEEKQDGTILPMLYQFDETATGIEMTNLVPATNENAPAYNLAGQRVGQSYKGIVIKNGKKFYNK